MHGTGAGHSAPCELAHGIFKEDRNDADADRKPISLRREVLTIIQRDDTTLLKVGAQDSLFSPADFNE